MEKIKDYIKTNHLKLIIILFLLFIVFQQTKILKEAKYCQCSWELDEIQNDLRNIKDKLGL